MSSQLEPSRCSGSPSAPRPIRIASDIGGVLLEGVKDASTTDGEDYGAHSALISGALDGLRTLSAEYEVWLLSYCGEHMEAKTRAALQAFGVADIVPEERWRFTRTRPEKTVVMRAENISLLVDDRGDIVGSCHLNYLRAVLFLEEKNGGTGWPGILHLVRAALAAPIPNPQIALDAFTEARKRLQKPSAAAALSAPASKPPKASAAPAPEPQRRFLKSVSFLGTGSGLPTRHRSASATVMSFADNAQWLFDCGEGTQVQFGRSGKEGKALAEALPGICVAQGVSMGSVTRIFITHLHGDHVFGLPGFILTLAGQWGAAHANDEEDWDGAGDDQPPTFQPFNDDTEFLEIVGPVGLAAFLRCALVSSDSRHFGFRYRVSEILGSADVEPVYPPAFSPGCHPSTTLHFSEAPPRVLRPDSDGATTIAPGVLAAPIDHRVTCYGFSVTEADKAGALDAQRATELGVVGKDLRLLKDLKAGKDVTLSDGRTVRSSDCVLPPSPGRVIIHLGDCIDNSASARAARGSGPCPLVTRASREGRSVALVVHEATFCDALVSQALPKGHCTARHAAAYAAEARAEVLCLTHLSQRYLPRSHGPDAAAEIDALEGEARAELAARGASSCTVRCVEDFEAINAPSKK
jgi:ribonuclease Z